MLMKMWVTKLMFIMIALFLTVCSFIFGGDSVPSQKVESDIIPYDFHGETDKTDIFAIPLDSSQAEIQEEIAELKSQEKSQEASKKSNSK